MKPDNKTIVRQLLDRYYQGLSSRQEEDTLREYFSGDYDPEFAADAEVFAALGALGPGDAEIPAGLEEKILAIASVPCHGTPAHDDGYEAAGPSPVPAPPRRWRFRRVIYAAVGVAAALLVALLVIRGVNTPIEQQLSLPPVTASLEIVRSAVPDTMAVIPESAQAAPASKKQPKAAPAATLAPDLSGSLAQAETDSFYREIDDPEEAAKILEEVTALLARNFSASSNALLLASYTMDDSFVISGNALSLTNNTIDESITQYKSITNKLSE